MLRSRTLKTIPAAVVALTMLLPLALPLAPAVEAASGTPTYTNYAGPTDFSRFPQGSPVAFINGGEPSVGVNWNTGAVLYQHGFDTYRVDLSDTSSESTWTDVSPPNTQFNVDPLLYTDPVTGRTFAGGLDGTCSVLAFTDDDGGTWTPMGNPCVATLDHPSIVSGPWRNGVPLPGATYDRAVYYCAQASFVTCTMSMDGGLTFGPAAQVSCQFINPGLHGSAHVAPDGRVYIPFKNCGGQIGVARSDNHGLSWTWSKVAGSTTPQRGFDPDVATTPSGWVYISYQNGDNGAYAALSKNHGRTWSTPVDLGASLGLTATVFHETVAGDDDRAAVAFLGTTGGGNPFAKGFDGVWHLYVATTYDAGETWTTVRATTDPVQRGWICTNGTGCDSGRNLLDFMDAQVDEIGRIVVSYADGCVNACAKATGTKEMSTASATAITRQTGGRTLFSAYDGTADPLTVSTTGPYAGTPGSAVGIAGTAVGGTTPHAYEWSIVDTPADSAADAGAFGDTAAASTTFTPDVEGAYQLRLSVTDASGATAFAIADLVATPPSESSVVLEDEENDAGLAGTDIKRVRILDETAESFVIALEVPDLAFATPSTLNTFGISTGVVQSYTVGWKYAESSDNVVSYQVNAEQYAAAVGAPSTVFELQVVGSGASNYVTNVGAIDGTWNGEAGLITWTVPKAEMDVKKAATGPGDTSQLDGGRTPVAGDALSDFDAEVRMWTFALAGASFVVWDSATGTGSYTFVE